MGVDVFDSLDISIHAPQWGATAVDTPRGHGLPISIHAPQWGATRPPDNSNPMPRYFNPRTPVGCDERHFTVHSSGIEISIHAPQWGATVPSCANLTRPCYFNPRTPVGCDCKVSVEVGMSDVFQSTHPSGVRPISSAVDRSTAYFNPRTPVGCDSDPLRESFLR